MGITNNIPPSRLIQPGVIDNAAARPASPFEGQCIFQKDTDQLLVWNGTAWVMPNKPAQNPDGLEFITQVSPTAASTIAISNCFSSAYDNYKIKISPISVVSASDIRVKLLINTTPLSTGYYMTNIFASSGTVSSNSENNQTSFRGVYCGAGGIGTGPYNFLEFDMFQPFTVTSTRYNMISSAWDNTVVVNRSATGFHDSATSFNGFELSASSNITATIAVYGYRK